MCRPFPCSGVKQGIAMTPEVMAAMPEEEQSFWRKFFQTADEAIASPEGTGDEQSWEPSEEFRQMYQTAVEKYDGRKYCRVLQLQDIFSF